jgi:eukaryotic-like serine/threonine-protein kinase
MKPDRHRVSDLYHRALDQPPGARRAYLDEACDGDDVLRAEVESLLHHEPAAADLLERPAAAIAGGTAGPPVRPSMVDVQLGPYTILAPLGAGGMGEVYRARDSKLGREVAIKLLPANLTADPERRGRFAREARLLATLNHPHIGAIYGLEDADGLTALVLELVEGPTLADRLARGPLPVPQALAVARQIADALDAAHEKGIVHRDLKPANIVMQRATGSSDVSAKVLDFGLAKLVANPLGPLVEPPSGSRGDTEDGRILGTPAYMSPEQARGLPVDKRTDIWAFGCVLFEMLTGRGPFEGASVTDTLARDLERDPDWPLLPRDTPASVRTLLHRCLRRNPRKRLHDIADVLIELDEAESGSALPDPSHQALRAPDRRERLRWVPLAFLAGALLAAGTLTSLPRRTPAAANDSIEFAIGPPPGSRFNGPFPRPGQFGSAFRQFMLSPDGSQLVIVALAAHVPTLWVRPLGSGEYRQLRGTEGAVAPFWSADSRQIAFFAKGRLKVVAAAGGYPFDVGDVGSSVGGAWNEDDVILLGSAAGPLHTVASTGGTATQATALANGETSHRWPWFLPDGRHFLFLATGNGPPQLRVGSLDSTDSMPLDAIRSNAMYASGHLLFVDEGLMAQPFDARSRRLHGAPFRLSEQMMTAPNGRGPFTVSETGLLAYSGPTRIEAPQLTWMDRTGNRLGTVAEPAFRFNLALSPDDRRVAGSLLGRDGNIDIWVIDLDRQSDEARVTSDPGLEYDPAWSRDGKHLAFNSTRLGSASLFRRPSDASGRDELLAEAGVGTPMTAPDWSPDDRFIVFSWRDDLWVLPLNDAQGPSVLLETPFREWEPAFSPDGRWIVYSSDLTGRREIYVRPFRSTGPEDTTIKISRDGGLSPRWRSSGEIFFLSLDGTMMSAPVAMTGSSVQPLIPQALFPTGLESVTDFHAYDVAKDGQRFLIPVLSEVPGSNAITVITNWTSRAAK